jgi:hypothetical protein
MRILLLASILLSCSGARAQQQVKIIDPAFLDEGFNLHKSKAGEASIKASSLTTEQQELVLKYCDEAYWPAGIRNESARKANAPYLQNYAAYRISAFEDSMKRSVVMIPAQGNIHMPEDMRPLADFYLVMPDKALQEVVAAKPRPSISRGPSWKNNRTVKIIKADDLYATYDLGSDTAGLQALAKRGMSQPEIDAVVFRSHERNWPDGIDSFDERYPRIADFAKYKCYLGAKWDDKVLLIVPVEKNKKMPALMRPYVDLYFIYAASAVEIAEKKN